MKTKSKSDCTIIVLQQKRRDDQVGSKASACFYLYSSIGLPSTVASVSPLGHLPFLYISHNSLTLESILGYPLEFGGWDCKDEHLQSIYMIFTLGDQNVSKMMNSSITMNEAKSTTVYLVVDSKLDHES